MHHILAWILFLSLTTTLSHATSAPSFKQPDSPFDTIGLRLGGDVNADVSLTSYELFVTSEPQWSCELSEKVNAQPRLHQTGLHRFFVDLRHPGLCRGR